MNNKFFFINSYDGITEEILSSIINTHPDIECGLSHQDPFLDSKSQSELSKIKLDEFIGLNAAASKKIFTGNTGSFSAFELQHKTLKETAANPYRAANIILNPKLRINLVLAHWEKTQLDSKLAIRYIKQQIKKPIGQKDSLFDLHNFIYFYELVHDTIKREKLADLTAVKTIHFALALAKVITLDTADIPAPAKNFSFEKLLDSPSQFIKLLNHLTCSKLDVSEDFRQQLETTLRGQKEFIDNLEFPAWEPWQEYILAKVIKTKLKTLYYPHIDKPLAAFYAEEGYAQFEHTQSTEKLYSKLISIQLNSNRPAQLAAYFDNIEETADNPAEIEVLVNIDIGNQAMKSLLDAEIPQRKFTLKYIETVRPKSFCDLWAPINKLLEITDPNSYFLVNISDEMLFATQGWDSLLKKYVGFFPDHMFRLRCSRNKFRNYFDRWECSFAQDAIPITTKKWVDIGGDWNPCFGPDSFQQLVMFYLAKEGRFSNINYLREAPLTEIGFAGDVPAIGIEADKSWKHNHDHINAMLICQSYKMQLEARRRAMLIKANILAQKNQLENYAIIDIKSRKQIHLLNKDNNLVLEKLDYKVNRLAISLTNQWRKLRFFNYFGDGKDVQKGLLKSFGRYLKAKYRFAYKFHNRYIHVKAAIKRPLVELKHDVIMPRLRALKNSPEKIK